MMTKEEDVARAMCIADREKDIRWRLYIPRARAAIAAADKWDEEQSQPAISQGFDDALQAELDHPPASILGKE
jgi:hypothetical protein